jgi:hypothetical protein
MKQSLKSVICRALDDLEVRGKVSVKVAKIADNCFKVGIEAEPEYLDDIDELAIYDALEDSEYADYDVNLEISQEESNDDKLFFGYALTGNDDYEQAGEGDKFSRKTDEEQAAEEDDLHIFDPSEEYSDSGEDDPDSDVYEDTEIPVDLTEDYESTWEDLAEFEKEFGEDYE